MAEKKENLIYLDLEYGRVTIETRPDIAPNHVKQINDLVKEGFYDNIVFHRVIDGFMAQTGDPKGDGTGGSEKPDLTAEFSKEKHLRGTVSMARASDPHSANSQWFICLEDAPHLDGQYTIWGIVIDGMEIVDKIKKGDGPNGMVSNPDKIIKMQLAIDAEK